MLLSYRRRPNAMVLRGDFAAAVESYQKLLVAQKEGKIVNLMKEGKLQKKMIYIVTNKT